MAGDEPSQHPGAAEANAAGRLERVIALAVGAASLLAVALSYGGFNALAEALDHAPRAFVDFMYVYYPAGKKIFESADPVQGFFYSPFFALVMAPFASLPAPVALAAWKALQIAAFVATGLLGFAAVRPRRGLAVPYALAVAFAFPLWHGLSWGQVSGPLVALALAAVVLAERGRPALAGVLLGVTAAVKYYTLPLAGAFVLGDRWRAAVATALAFAVLAFAVPAAALGVGDTMAFYRGVAAMTADNAETLRADANSQYFAHVVARAVSDGPKFVPTLVRALQVAGGVLSALVLAMAWVVCRRGGARALPWSYALIFLTTPLWVPTSWPHYFVYLPFCQLLLAHEGWASRARWRRVVGISAAAASALGASLAGFTLAGGEAGYGPGGWLLGANTVALLASVALLSVRGDER